LTGKENIQIDGRPLHAYRISEPHYADLEVGIRQKLRNNQVVATAADFAIWSAERYRKEYDGGALSWDFLTQPLGISWDQSALRNLTREGLRQLQRPLKKQSSGTQYLRTLAAEGGIPVKLLSGAGGYKAALVGLVSDLARFGLGCPREVALGFASRRCRRLPQGYQTLEFRELFVDFGFEVLELRALAPDGLSSIKVAPWLDKTKPNWRECLSLRLDGDAARALLSEAVAVTRRTGLATDPVGRVLHLEPDGTWSSWIEFADTAEIAPELLGEVDQDRRRLRLNPTGTLANAVPDLMLELYREVSGEPWQCRRLSAERTARVRYPLDQAGDLTAHADGKFLARVRVPGGGAVDLSSGPSLWRLAEAGESKPQALAFAGSASVQTQDPAIWLLAVKGSKPDFTEDLIGERFGETEDGVLWRLSGNGRVLVSGGNAKVQTGVENDGREEILAIGPLAYRIRDAQGAPVQNGLPEILHRRVGRGFRKLTAKEVWHRMWPTKKWSNGFPTASALGRLEIAAKEGQAVGPRIAIKIVPAEMRVSDVAQGKTGRRRIKLSGLPPHWSVRIADEPVVTADVQGLALIDLSHATSRGQIPISLAGPAGEAPINWLLNLPQKYGQFQDRDGYVLTDDRYISMQDLRDWRITPAENNTTELRIRLHGGVTVLSPVIGKSVTAEQPLSSFRPLFQEMLGIGGPDAELRLRVVTEGIESKRLVLRHALGSTSLDENVVAVMKNRVPVVDPTLQLFAVDMMEPEQIVQIDPTDLSMLSDGKWFLMPRLNGAPMRPPRPYVKPAPVEKTGAHSTRRDDRVEHFCGTYTGIGSDAELVKVANLSSVLIAHDLSPQSLDQVLALERVPEAGILVLLRVKDTELADMLSLEFHGGPRWMFIAPDVWARAFALYTSALSDQLGQYSLPVDQIAKTVGDALGARVADILRLQPAIAGQVLMGLFEVDARYITEIAQRMGGLPPGIQNPKDTLNAYGNDVVRRNAVTATPLYELKVNSRPASFDQYDTNLEGLLNAPLFVAEIALAIRPPPTTRQQVELLQAIQMDMGAFESALPAAIAWYASRQGDKR